jgi:hypothetical protein
LPPWPFEFPLLPGAEDDGTEGTVGVVVLGALGAVGVGFGAVGAVGKWGGEGGVCVVDEPCVGAFDGLLGSVGLAGLFGAVVGLDGLDGLLGAVAGLGGLVGGVGFEGFEGFDGWDGFPWLPLFPGADGAVGPFGAFGLVFGPCAFGGRSPCGPFPCGFGFGPGTDGTAGFDGLDGFAGVGLGFEGEVGTLKRAFCLFVSDLTCSGVVAVPGVCAGGGGGDEVEPPGGLVLPPPLPFPVLPPDWGAGVVDGLEPAVEPATVSAGPAVASVNPDAMAPVAVVVPPPEVDPLPVAMGPAVPGAGAPRVAANDAGEMYAGTTADSLLREDPPTCGSWSTWPVARAQRKMDAATPAPSSPRLAPKRIRPPTKGQITTVSGCSQTSIHQALAESVTRDLSARQRAPIRAVDSPRKGREDNFRTERCGGTGGGQAT